MFASRDGFDLSLAVRKGSMMNQYPEPPGEQKTGPERHIRFPFTNSTTISTSMRTFKIRSADDGTPVVEYFHAVLYRKWLVCCVFVISIGLAALYVLKATPYYKSTATLEIEKVYPTSAGLNELFAFFGQSDLHYQTQLESLKSRNLAEKFLDRMNASSGSGPKRG